MQDNITNISTKQAIIYIRVSSEEQVENFSLQTQEEICRRDAKYKGYEVANVFREEGKSAKTIIGRPTLVSMLDYCRQNKKNIQALFVYRLDRLSRQTSDYLAIRARLLKYGISIISATEPTGNSPTEKLLETVLASFAQHDNDVRSERTKNGMRARFLSGLVCSHFPKGYINQGGFAVKDPDSFDKYKNAWELLASGTKSLKEMTLILKEWGIKTNKSSLYKIFKNKFYMGILTSPRYPEVIEGKHVPMITKETYYRVQDVLKGRDPNKLLMPRKSRDNSEFPLRRIIRCGKCGSLFTGANSKGRSKKYSYYFCRNRCVNSSVSTQVLNDELFSLLKKLTPTQNCIKLYCNFLLKSFKSKQMKLNKIKNEANQEIEKLNGLRQTLVEKNLAGIYSDDIFKEQNAMIEDKLIAAYSSKNDEIISKYDIEAIAKYIEDKISNLAETCAKSTLSQLRCLLGSIFLEGLYWDYPGCSNRRISPVYQSILNVENGSVPLGDPNGIRIHVFRMRT